MQKGVVITLVIVLALVIAGSLIFNINEDSSDIGSDLEDSSTGLEEAEDIPPLDDDINFSGTEEETQDTTAQTTKTFEIISDDRHFDPNIMQVNQGDLVEITFNFNDDAIYYGGLDIKSDYFNIQYRKSDTEKSKTASFTAEDSFTFTSYWPSSGVRKATGTVSVM